MKSKIVNPVLTINQQNGRGRSERCETYFKKKLRTTKFEEEGIN